jgi:dienelactone hydrolase
VGVRTLEIESAGRSLPVDVWYPADARHAGEDVRPGGGAAHPFGRPHLAVPDARPAQGSFPLLAFSHGNSGVRRQSTFLTTWLASRGHVVAAPDHVGNTFFEMLELDEPQKKAVHLEMREWRPLDLVGSIDAALKLESVDASRIGAFGHSFGGWTALKMPAADPRVRTVCGLAPASEPFVGRKAFAPGELPFRAPVLLIAGRDDVLVDLETSVEPLYSRLGTDARLLVVDGLDHFHFCDGIALLHQGHLDNPRDNQLRPTRPLSELQTEERTHALLCALVGGYFEAAFGAEPFAAIDAAHPGVQLVEPTQQGATA